MGYVIFVALLLAGPVLGQSQHHRPDILTLRYLLKHRMYADLQKRIETYQRSFEEDLAGEENLWTAIEAFDTPDPTMEPYLSEWIARAPNSYAPYVARAQYFISVGWHARGYRYAGETSKEQFQAMAEYFLRAMDDLKKATAINSRLTICNDLGIQMAMHAGDKVFARRHLDAALAVQPAALNIRLTYMWSLQPRWGGSYEEMERLAVESEQHLDRNPGLRVLHGYVPFDKGVMLQQQDSHRNAIARFNEALQSGERPMFYGARGDSYFSLEQYDLALADYDAGLKLAPQKPELIKSKAQTLLALGRPAEARPLLQLAAQFDPPVQQSTGSASTPARTPGIDHDVRGYELYKEGKYSEAVAEYSKAIQANPSDGMVYARRGEAYRQLKNDKAALDDYDRAIERNPGDASLYYNAGWIHLRNQQYDEAVAKNSMAIRHDPGYASAYLNRANALGKLGRIDEALRDLQRACDLGSTTACEFLKKRGGR